MDTLLQKLRQHMAELSLQGDDFTRQMWQMYAIFEDLLERQNVANETSPYLAEASSALMQHHFNAGRLRTGDVVPGQPTLASSLTADEEAYLDTMLNSCNRMTAGGYDLWSTLVGAQRKLDDDDSDDDDEDVVEGQLQAKLKLRLPAEKHDQGKPPVYDDSTTEFDSDELLEADRQQSIHHGRHYLPRYYQSNFQSSQPVLQPYHHHHQQQQQQRSVRRHRHRPRRRLPATPTTHCSSQVRSQNYHTPPNYYQHHYQDYFSEELTRSSPSVNTDGSTVCNGGRGDDGSSDPIGSLVSKRATSLPYRRSSAPELLDNPLLETISTIENLCESDEYGELPSSKRATPLLSSNNSSGLSVDKDGAKMVKSEASSSAEDKAQHSSDGDRDSVGYAGSNSVDSGYKSSCPTPELLDPCYYAQDALCNGSKRLSLSSRASRDVKPRIPMGTRVIGRHTHSPHHHHHHRTAGAASLPWSTLASNSSTSTSSSSCTSTLSSGGNGSAIGGSSSSASVATPNRPEYGYYDVNLDHLMYLRQSLLSAIQRCGGSSSPAKVSPDDSEGSGPQGGASGPTTAGTSAIGVTVQASPIRSRSGSCTSRGSPDPQKLSPSTSPLSSQVRSVRFKPEVSSSSDLNASLSQLTPLPATNISTSITTTTTAATTTTTITATTQLGSNFGARQLVNVNFGETSVKKPPGRQPTISTASPFTGDESDFRDDESCSTTAQTLEEEIDMLLYGKAEYYDLESVKEFPCSYGTLLEHKYRHSSLAKVKRLKDSLKIQEPDCFLKGSSQFQPFQPSSSPPRCAVGLLASSVSDKPKSCEPLPEGGENLLAATTITTTTTTNSTTTSTSSVTIAPDISQIEEPTREAFSSQGQLTFGGNQASDASAGSEKEGALDKARFSEVAKCMLKIIEDIQHQQQNGTLTTAPTDPQTLLMQQTPGVTKDSTGEDHGPEPVGVASTPSTSGSVIYDSQRLSGADYHVYEEITYDLVAVSPGHFLRDPVRGSKVGGTCGQFKMDDVPPPLPARPNEIFGSGSLTSSIHRQAPFGNVGIGGAGYPQSFISGATQGAATAQPKTTPRNPINVKRRGNFYSIFTEQSERRHLSQSLEREWQKSNESGISGAEASLVDPNDDEYGFKAVKKSLPH